MSKFYVIITDDMNKENDLKKLREMSLMMLRELRKAEPKILYPFKRNRSSQLCQGAFANMAIDELLNDNIHHWSTVASPYQRWLMLRDDGRIIYLTFTIGLTARKPKAEIV